MMIPGKQKDCKTVAVVKEIVLDLETTGLRAYRDHILEVAAVVLDGRNEEIDRFSTLVHPGAEALRGAEPAALAVNGLGEAALAGAPVTDQAAKDLRAFLDRHKPFRLHAYPNEFEQAFLVRTPWNLADPWGECLMQASMGLMGEDLPRLPDGRIKRPRLAEAAAFFGVSTEEKAHRALVDARTAARVWAGILASRNEETEADEATDFL
jgi:DNA polymerase-3 subunit epsilon